MWSSFTIDFVWYVLCLNHTLQRSPPCMTLQSMSNSGTHVYMSDTHYLLYARTERKLGISRVIMLYTVALQIMCNVQVHDQFRTQAVNPFTYVLTIEQVNNVSVRVWQLRPFRKSGSNSVTRVLQHAVHARTNLM